jgi:hypothetical protein
MTTVRDVIANLKYRNFRLGEACADEILCALLSAPESVRLELAAKLIPPRDRMRPAFPNAMTIAEHGFDAWAAKAHNAKWVRLIDGTPIKNDLLVNIALAICEPPTLPAPPSEDKMP